VPSLPLAWLSSTGNDASFSTHSHSLAGDNLVEREVEFLWFMREFFYYYYFC
jgi:hypothetical protein